MMVAAAEFPINSPAYRISGVAEIIARTLAPVPADSHEAKRLLSRYGGVLGASEGDYDGAQQALSRAMDIARCEGDIALEVQTLTYTARVNGQHLHWQESADNGLRAIELATADENPFSDLISRFWTALGRLALDNLDAARPHVLVMRDLADRRSTPRLLATNHLLVATTLACLEGDWKSGRELGDHGLECYRYTHYTWEPELRWSLSPVRPPKEKSIFRGSSRRCVGTRQTRGRNSGHL